MKFERFERRLLARGAAELSYCDTLAGELPVVLQHGLCGSARQTAEAFPDDDRLRLLTLECRGHGASPIGPLQEISLARFADDVVALIDALPLAPVMLGGISMGAAIALRIAIRRPERVRALMLLRPAWITDAAPANMRANAEVGELLARTSPAEARALFEAGATARRLAAEAPDNLASLRGFFDREPAAETAALLSRIAADGPGITEDEVRALALPALVIGHEHDAIHPMACARALVALLRHGELVEITPKSVDREAYVHDLQAAVAAFIEKAA